MALPTYQSSTSASGTASASPAKPTGLSVGDILCAFGAAYGATIITAPANWITIFPDVAGSHGACSFYKVADAADVAASSFAFAAAGASKLNVGLMRISTDNLLTPYEQKSSASVTTGTPSAAGFTPIIGGGLFVIMVGYAAQDQKTMGSYAIATNNPTWTEALDGNVQIGGGNTDYLGVSMAYANRGRMTATGGVTFAFSPNANNMLGAFVQLVNFVPALPLPLSLSVTLTRPTTPILATPFVLTALLPTPAFSDVPATWSPVPKHETAWTPTPRS